MRLWILYIVIVLIVSCKKDKPFGPQFLETEKEEIFDSTTTQLIIINEGNFTLSNATITSHEIETGTTRQKLFEQANEKSLGDVGQSILVSGDMGFIAVNNSNLLIKVHLPECKEITRTDITTPRYSLITSKGELWVTSMNGKDLYVLDTADLKLLKRHSASDWLETLVEADNHVFTCNVKKGTVDVYTLEGILVSTIAVGRQPQSIVLDTDGALWVLCDGGFDPRDRDFATLHKIDPITRKVAFTYTFDDIEYSPSRLLCNKDKGILYFINRAVYSFKTDLSQSEPVSIYEKEGANLYGLGWIATSKSIVVTDVKDYVKQGTAFVLDENGKSLYEFNTGVIPQHIAVYD